MLLYGGPEGKMHKNLSVHSNMKTCKEFIFQNDTFVFRRVGLQWLSKLKYTVQVNVETRNENNFSFQIMSRMKHWMQFLFDQLNL